MVRNTLIKVILTVLLKKKKLFEMKIKIIDPKSRTVKTGKLGLVCQKVTSSFCLNTNRIEGIIIRTEGKWDQRKMIE